MTLTHGEEHALYERDRPAWLREVAPRMAAKLREASAEAIGETWAALQRDYQRAVWPLLDADTQQRIRAVRADATTRNAA